MRQLTHWQMMGVVVLLSGVLTPAVLAATQDAHFPIEATVFSDIQISKIRDLSFGTHATVSGNTNVNPSQSAQFQIVGNPSASVTGAFNSSSITLTCTSKASCGTDTITVNTFTCSGTDFQSNCAGKLSSSGTATVNVNAILRLTASDRAGSYSGTQAFSVNYS